LILKDLAEISPLLRRETDWSWRQNDASARQNRELLVFYQENAHWDPNGAKGQ